MAPIHDQQEEFNKYRVRLLNLSRSIPKISSIDDLMDARQEYLDSIYGLTDFFKRENLDQRATSLFLNDEVVNHHMTGGAGVSLDDKRAQSLISALEKEVPLKIERLDKLYEIFDVHHLIEKRGSTFFYLGQPIILSENTHSWHLLDVLYTFSGKNCFVSYKNIFDELGRRKRKGLLTSRSALSETTIKNARDELFSGGRLGQSGADISKQTPSGKRLITSGTRGKTRGLIFNNEPVS